MKKYEVDIIQALFVRRISFVCNSAAMLDKVNEVIGRFAMMKEDIQRNDLSFTYGKFHTVVEIVR